MHYTSDNFYKSTILVGCLKAIVILNFLEYDPSPNSIPGLQIHQLAPPLEYYLPRQKPHKMKLTLP